MVSGISRCVFWERLVWKHSVHFSVKCVVCVAVCGVSLGERAKLIGSEALWRRTLSIWSES